MNAAGSRVKVAASFATGVALGSLYGDRVYFGLRSVKDRFFPEKKFELTTAKDLMKYAVELSGTCGKFATLSTVSSSSGVASRTVQPFDVEFEEGSDQPTIYFNTNVHSQKVKHLMADSRVNMTYVNMAISLFYSCYISY